MKNKFKILFPVFISLLIISLIFNHYCSSFYQYNEGLTVHYINVDQGDSELIQVNNKNLLIDAGSREYRKDLLSYLAKCNIKKLDYVIATHPHEDHIGAMADVINSYEIGEFYAPKVTSNTKYFEKMIDALKRKGKKINIINNNTNSIDLGKDVSIRICSPTKDSYDNLNNYSPVLKLSYKNISFLFTGDAEKEVENEISSSNLKSDVIKIGHHGSSSSSSLNFIKAVNPAYAIISCGKDNSYGHPHKQTLTTLDSLNIKILRTDINDDIVFYSNGNKVIHKE